MGKKFKSRVIVFIVAIMFCAPLTSDWDRPADLPHPGMRKIRSAGTSFHQGWNNRNASYDERPGMQTAFTCDYWIDTTELTQKKYYDVTGNRPVTAGSPYGAGDNYPVYNVSWFDAVLYCNARSKAEGLDTVYVYSGVKALENGRVYDLTGLRYDLTRDGYRLPTEAEWEYAARGASSALPFTAAADSSYACYYAWYGKNSSNKSHPVGTLLPNSLGLYDMAGNVFEWTNDWKCMYDGKGITNSLGAYQPGREYEKVIKGGAYSYPLMYLRYSRRSATYATILSAATEYVGFRCARGPIPNGQYIGIGQTAPNPPIIMINGSDLRSFIGTSEAKLVFVNVTGPNRTLCHVDFSRTFPYVQEYLDDRNVYMPVISPDGRYVAYCSRNEGQSGLSKISIRSLDSLNSPIEQLATDSAYIPRWWVDRQSGVDTFLIYTNSACDNGVNSLWSSTKTYRQNMSGGKPVGVPLELISDGSYHDGLSADGRYAVTGFSRLMRRDFGTGLDTQLFVSPENGKDKDAEGSTRVCNVSMSPDTETTVRCMFLDFGYTGISTVTGTSYGIHQYLFVSNMSGAITDFIHCPPDEESWDYTEWSNQVRFRARFAVGCGRNSAYQAHAIYAIDVDGKDFRRLVTGQELQQPYLWTGFIHEANILDSLGQYCDPPLLQVYFSSKMHLFWQKHDSLELVFTGSSQVLEGFECSMITGLSSINMGGPGLGIGTAEIIIRNYVLHLCPKIRVICIGVQPDAMAYSGENAGNLWTNGFTSNKGYLCDQHHQFWENGIPPEYKEIIMNVPYYKDGMTNLCGFMLIGCLGWGTIPPPCGGSIDWTIDDTLYKTNFALLRSLVQDLSALKIHSVIVIFPVSPYYKNTDHFAPGGPSWPTGRLVMERFKSLENEYPYYHFYDAYNYGINDYDDSDAENHGHLCINGARKLTPRLDSLIHSFLNK